MEKDEEAGISTDAQSTTPIAPPAREIELRSAFYVG